MFELAHGMTVFDYFDQHADAALLESQAIYQKVSHTELEIAVAEAERIVRPVDDNC